MVPKQIPIFERTRFMFSGITDKVSLFDAMVDHLVPFQSGRKSGPSPSTKMCLFQLGDNDMWIILGHTLNPRLISPLLSVGFNLPWFTIYLPQHPRCKCLTHLSPLDQLFEPTCVYPFSSTCVSRYFLQIPSSENLISSQISKENRASRQVKITGTTHYTNGSPKSSR